MGVGFTLKIPNIDKYRGRLPYAFILDYLSDIEIKAMFGCYGVYAGGKLCLFLVDRPAGVDRPDGEPMQNGIYIATTATHCDQLRPEFEGADFQQLKGGKVWIFVAADDARFEQYAVRACEMISSGDPRIGR